MKESEKKDKYLDLARELKKPWNMKVTMIPVISGALGTVTKGLVQGLEDLEIKGRMETIQTTALLRSAKIFQGETISKRSCEKLKRVTVISGFYRSGGQLIKIKKAERETST